MKKLTKIKIVFVFVVACFAFSKTNYAQCPNPVKCSSGTNGDIVDIKLGGRGGTFTSATFSYDNGISFNAIGSSPDLNFKSSDSQKMTIKGNGNVGIGTTSPSSKLDVATSFRVSSSSNPGRDYKIICGGRQDVYANNDLITHVGGHKEFQIGTYRTNAHFCIKDGNGNKKFWVFEDGKVGIGTSSPKALLHVNGSMNLNGKISFYHSGSYYNGITTNSSGEMVFNVGPTQPIMQLASDRVNIGCQTSEGQLNVNGKIQAKELEIKAGPCSDYVFEPDYNLMSLGELENYVKSNKHLPEVPSAAEFEENGYNIGEMDDLLLRKVEELTLYVIELKKENDALKELISK